MLGCSAAEVQADRLGAARRAAAASGAVVVLKGQLTLIAVPPDPPDSAASGVLSINPTGNPGMATGGSGDVLTGMIAALLAQQDRLEGTPAIAAAGRAAATAVYLHGLAGDLAAERLGEHALVAGDLLAELPRAWRRLAAADRRGPGERPGER